MIDRFEVARVRVSQRTTWTLIRLSAGGQTGLGECSDGGSADELEGALAAAAQATLGSGIEDPHPALAPGLAATTVAGAIELACLDLLGQRGGRPIWQLLGGADPGPVELYANINRAANPRTPEGFAAVARRAVDDGFRAVKCAPFDQPDDQGLKIVEAIREAVGPVVGVMVDVHNRLTQEQVVALLPDFERLHIAWLEDAVAIDQPDHLRDLSRRTAIPLAGGEMCSRPEELQPSLGEGGLKIVLPDVKHAGGLRAARQLAQLAAAHGAQVSPHNPTSPIGSAASLHLAALVPNLTSLEFAYGEADWRPTCVTPEERPHLGRLALPTGPGLGITTNPNRVQFTNLGGER